MSYSRITASRRVSCAWPITSTLVALLILSMGMISPNGFIVQVAQAAGPVMGVKPSVGVAVVPDVAPAIAPSASITQAASARFEWAMKQRFFLDADYDRVIDYDYSRCYLQPEHADCPPRPWVVTFNGLGSYGKHLPLRFDWVVAGDARCHAWAAPRIEHTATPLPNGKVLVVGGRSEQNDLLRSAQLFDPPATIIPTGNMNTPRKGHTATVLPNGKVLITGGGTRRAELFDPSNGTFSSVKALMTEARDEHSATVLADGKVLIVGGRQFGTASTAEIFDPTAEIFVPTSEMTVARETHKATLLQDGRVLITGGAPDNFAELYDPSTGTFAPAKGGVHSLFQSHTATLLANGKVLIAGGQTGTAPHKKAAELFDPSTNAFTTTGIMTGRVGHTATRLQDGQVLIAGGRSGTYLTTAQLYNPVTGAFTETKGALRPGRHYHTATLLSDGRVLFIGGISPDLPGRYLSAAEVYHADTRAFGPAETAPIPLAVAPKGAFVDSPVISCAFSKQGTYDVTLRVQDQVGSISSVTQKVIIKDLLIVSIGDSAASGEGNPDLDRIGPVSCVTEQHCRQILRELGATEWQIDHRICLLQGTCSAPVRWQDKRCHRSFHSGPALAAASIELEDFHTSVTFLHLACSGARIDAGLIDPYAGQEERLFECPSDPVDGVCQEARNLASNPPVLNKCSFPLTDEYGKPHPLRRMCLEMLPPQIDQLARYLCANDLGSDNQGRTLETCPVHRLRKIDVLLISIGANDLGFGQIVAACALLENCMNRSTHDSYHPAINDLIRAVQNVSKRLGELPKKYERLNKAIQAKLVSKPAPKIFITEYFDPLRDANGAYCDPALPNVKEWAATHEGIRWLGLAGFDALYSTIDFDGITNGEAAWAFNNILVPLNGGIAAAAKANNWIYVSGIASSFATHGVCAGTQKWVLGLDASNDAQGNLDGAMHPNLPGQTAYQSAILGAVRKVLGQ